MSSSVTAGSVSKGVFVFKGKKTVACEDEYFGNCINLPAEQQRLLQCKESWEKMDEQIQMMQSDLNTKIFEDLLSYVANAHKDFNAGTALEKTKHAHVEIPTAALVTGVNMPDHDVMFGNLVSLFKDKVTPLTAVLRSKDCPNVKAIMAKTMSQVMDNSEMLEEEGEEDNVNMRRLSCTMDVLISWYRQIGKKCSSPRKRKADGSPMKQRGRQTPANPPVVLILEDLESFVPKVLQDFITICSNRLHQLPVVLVFGIATTVTAVHRLLPQGVSSLLCMEKFQAPPSSEYLSQVIQQIVMTPEFPFKLGGKVFNLLLDIFLYHDFSVVGFVRGIQFSLLDHFYSHPSSILCVPFTDLDAHLEGLSHAELENIRSHSSFRRVVESKKPQEKISLLEDDAYSKDFIAKCLATLDHYHRCFFPLINCVHILTHRLPGSPLGNKVRQLYGTSLGCNICDTDEFKECMTLLRALSRDEMLDKLSQCVQLLGADSLPDDMLKVKETLAEFNGKFENIEALSKEYEEKVESTSASTAEETKELPKKMDMYTLRQKLQEMEKKCKKLTVYEVIRGETIDYLDSIFRKYLKCPTKFPLHEVYYYNNTAAVRSHLNGSPRATIQNGLANPYYYLQHEDLKFEGLSISPSLPDLCIVYKLHLECGRLINLYDWLQAFAMVVLAGDGDQENTAAPPKPDKLLQARFIRAVSELQFLGFIKPTKRKTDHVARLTWGGC